MKKYSLYKAIVLLLFIAIFVFAYTDKVTEVSANPAPSSNLSNKGYSGIFTEKIVETSSKYFNRVVGKAETGFANNFSINNYKIGILHCSPTVSKKHSLHYNTQKLESDNDRSAAIYNRYIKVCCEKFSTFRHDYLGNKALRNNEKAIQIV